MIRLSTIGPISVHIGNTKLPSKNHQVIAALLHLVVERGKPVPRRTLVEMFFPNAADDAGWHSSRQLVYRLRKLGADVEGDPVNVTIPADSATWDVETLLARGTARPDELEALERGYLSDFSPDHSDRFTRWLEEHREGVVGKLRHLLIAQLKEDRVSRRYRNLELVARACLSLDPLNEEATLARAESLAMTGAKSDALRLLDRYLDDIGTRSPELRLAPRVLRERISEYSAEPGRASVPFVGREVELETLGSMIAQSASGTAHACVVIGPSGIGKTRLIGEATTTAALAGHSIAKARLSHLDQSRPFAVLRDLGPALLDLPGSLGSSPEAVAAVRGLCGRGPSQYVSKPADTFDTQAIVAGIHGHVLDLMGAVAEEQPLTLVIEDAHWIDLASMELIASLLNDAQSVCVILATQRELPLPHTLAANPSTTTVRLPPLSPEQSRDLLHRLFARTNRSADGSFIASAARVAGGSPFYLQLLFENFLATGSIEQLPDSLSASLTTRLAQLAEPAKSVLDAIVVLGPASTESRVEQVTQLPRYSLIKALRELDDAGLTREDSGRLIVAHEIFAQTASERMPESIARLLHRASGHVLEAEKGTDIDPLAIAAHWEACGEVDRARAFLMETADHNSRLGRPREAMELLVRSRRLATTDGHRREIDHALLHACRDAGEDTRGIEVAERLGIYAGAGTPDDCLAAVHFLLGAGQHLAPHSELLRRLAADRSLSADSRSSAVHLLLVYAEDAGLTELAHEVLESVADLDDDHVGTLHVRLIYEVSFGSPDLALPMATRLRQAALTHQSPSRRLRYLASAAISMYRSGDVSAAIDGLHEAHALAESSKLWSSSLLYASLLADFYLDRGEGALSEHWYVAASSHLRRSGQRDKAFSFMAVGMHLALGRGDHVAARALLHEVRAHYPRLKSDRMGLESLAFSVRIDLAADRDPSPEDVEELLRGHLERRGDRMHDLIADSLFAALRKTGRGDQATRLRDEYLQLFRKDRIPISLLLSELQLPLARESR